MKKVTINGVMYIGNLKTTKNDAFNIKDAMILTQTGELTTNDFGNYLKDKVNKKLREVNFGGTGISYSVEELTKTEEVTLKTCELTMGLAKDTAVPKLVTNRFDELLGK